MRTAILLLFAAILSWGCTSAPAARNLKPREVQLEVSPEVQAQMERNLTKKAQQKEETFQALSRKSDEYQSLLGVCENLSDKEQNKPLREACSGMLRELRLELTELKGRLEEE